MTAVASTARLEARISTDLHALLKRAAEIEGRTVTDFVISEPLNRYMSVFAAGQRKIAARVGVRRQVPLK
jgi:uncharacterized protein (DUF1778 family)